MRTLVGTLLLLLMPVALPASNRDAKLQVLQTHQQSVQGVGVGAGGGGVSGGSVYTATNTTPCSQPFPDDATAIDAPGGGSLSQCTFAVPGAGVTGSAQVTYIKAILTTEAGSPYYVYLSCWKQYGTCTPLKENQTYLAKLSESAEQLADYAHRQVSTPISVSLRPDGKHKVTYTVLFVTKAPPQP